MNFNTLPNLVALAILVAVFRAILRRGTTERLHLWLAGWVLILIHFAAQFLNAGEGTLGRLIASVSYDSLALASIAFLISVSNVASDRRRQILMAIAIGVPALTFINGVIWDVNAASYYYAATLACVALPTILFCRYYKQLTLYSAGMVSGAVLTGLIITWTVVRSRADIGIIAILAALDFVVAILYWNRYRRSTAGVLTTVIGFGLWGLVFPAGLLFDAYFPSAKVESEVWNIPKYLVAVGMILTLLEDQIERSKYLAYHDELTGLPNRRLLEDRLEQAVAQAERTGNKLAVLLIDLDHFKEINDNFGHRIGDLALQGVARQLSGRMRAADTLARTGGDEFTVITAVADIKGTQVLISALQSALASPISVEGIQIQTGLSIGFALYPQGGRTPDQLMATADRAMYVSKRAGRTAVSANEDSPPPSSLASYLSTCEQP
jgi:diguanylate cyclase (GGDEF)-like protein